MLRATLCVVLVLATTLLAQEQKQPQAIRRRHLD